ncbi:acetyl-hydrolase [Didymella exigua CBS 183.55]|uniref:Acetyl-hydrolase n=1 Tax=Didymella exigua CBS 183.55 TaxID=1150837 RepID=A0A6A5RVT6_9PLEO|nr:acetyl-hydrolase [Didymella exigua CBS 183.55]KAF1932581.1 acetyl-hydrolase [Didymella exigua CBS 183.55]
MDATPSAMLKLLVPKVPFMLKTALWHTIGQSATSSKWDLRTELTINILRDMIGPNSEPSPISKIQRLTTKDPGIKGKVWVSKVKLNVPEEDDVRQLLFKAIEDMGTGKEQWTKPENRPLEAEWNGYRAQAPDPKAPQSADRDEKAEYANLMKEVSSRVTLLYFHGGAMYLLDPATYRPTTSRLAKETGGRVFSVRYRLAPSNPFPAALLDCFTAYLSLLHPPPGAPHSAVPANEIVFGGDSAGGTCCTALLQLLLQIHRSNPNPNSLPTVKFHGKDVDIPLPAGLAMTSPWLDITRGLPSIEGLAQYDYLPPPSQTDHREFPACSIWPASPPRADLYCEGSALLHPLVSPLAAKSWEGAPPLFFSLGQEMLRDEDAVLAQRAVGQGVKVVWREFEAMPHCFAMLLESNPGAPVYYKEFAKFCKEVVEARDSVQTNGEFIRAKTLQRSEVDVKGGLTKLTDVEVEGYMKKGQERIEAKFRRGRDPAAERPML